MWSRKQLEMVCIVHRLSVEGKCFQVLVVVSMVDAVGGMGCVGNGFLSLPPPAERPGLGCRELVARNLYRLVPAIGRDLSDWLVATRVRTSQLLTVLLLHAEERATQHLQPLLALLYRACADSEKEVVRNVSGFQKCLRMPSKSPSLSPRTVLCAVKKKRKKWM